MVNVRFSERETCKIVELYRAHECLWNPSNKYYLCKSSQKAACEAIAREMDIEDFKATDVKSKLRNIRGTFNQEKQKIKRFSQTGESYVPRLKWFGLMNTFFHKMKHGNNSVSQNSDQTIQCVILEDSQWEKSRSNAELSAEIEQSIRAITDTEVMTVTPEVQFLQSENHAAKLGIQSDQPDSPFLTVTPDILTLKAASNSESTPVTSGYQSAQSVSSTEVITISSENCRRVESVSNPTVTSAPPSNPTSTSAPSPKLFALIPEGQASNSALNNCYIAISPANKQNIMYREGNQAISLAPEKKQKTKQLSADETLESHKGCLEDLSSTNSNYEEFSDRIEDEMDVFGHLVAMNLRKLSLQSSLSAQAEILSVLTRYRLKDSAANPPAKQIVPYILTNSSSPTQKPVTLQNVFLKN